MMAILASYLAVDLAGQVTRSIGSSRLAWIVGGGFAMGTGIWSMHFIGMLAFSLPIPVRYHIPLVVLSFLAAVLASATALFVVSKPALKFSSLAFGSLFMGFGIIAMHYTGMAAMRLQATMVYDLRLVLVSIIVAITVSFIGLQLVFTLRSETQVTGIAKKIGGAVIMGSAIPAMHYTGMAAANFSPHDMIVPSSHIIIDISLLGGAAITIGTFVILGFTWISGIIDRRLTTQGKEIYAANESLRNEIAQRRRIEEALRDSEESYRLTIENALESVVTMDVQGKISGWNRQAEYMFGWTPQEAIGQSLVSLIVPPSFREAHNQGLERYRATGEGAVLNKRLEISALHRQGHEFPVELSISPIHSQGRVTFSAFIRDITSRKQTEDAIKSVAKFPDENPNPVLRVSLEGLLLYANAASSPLLATWETQIDQLVPPHVLQVVQEALHTKTNPELEVDCHQQICSLVVSPIIDEEYVNLYGRDVTQRKKAERALYEAKEAAELANRTKSEFLATMSHELRTPLTGILGYAQILKKETSIPQKQRNAVHVIEHSAEHLLSLINEILDLSRIEAGSLEIQLDELNLSKLLLNLSNTMRARSDDKRLSFTYECLSDLPLLVMGDERRLRQVLINLLDNAIKYTKEGGLALKVGYHEQRIRFLVEDTGMGIKPEHLESIFRSFQRVHDPKMGVEGTGLGLTISQKLVILMGGTLQVKSVPGEGSQFWFDLDLHEVKGSQEEPHIAEPKIIGITGERPRILIVDDKIDNRMFLNDLLTPLGFDVTEAEDGEECLGQAMTIRPDAILMDLRMPNMNGLEATRRIRQTPELKDVVIIAISASSFEHNRLECLKAGTDNFLSKPFRINKLLELLHHHLPIELVYDTATQEEPSPLVTTVTVSQADLRLPPPDRVEALLNLAKRGDVKNILAQIEELATASDYHVFSSKVETMAKSFQVTKLCKFLEEARNTP